MRAHWVADRMDELVLDVIRPNTQHFVQNRPRHRPEAMPSPFILVYARTSHSGENRIVAHGTGGAPRAGKNKSASTCQWVQLPKYFDRLT
jgi:hypothetical protein